jgi:hypothetical protein
MKRQEVYLALLREVGEQLSRDLWGAQEVPIGVHIVAARGHGNVQALTLQHLREFNRSTNNRSIDYKQSVTRSKYQSIEQSIDQTINRSNSRSFN